MNTDPFLIREAQHTDIEHIIALYFSIYGDTYPLKFGTDRNTIRKVLDSSDYFWPVMVDTDTQEIIGSSVFELDVPHKIGKLSGLVVKPEYRKMSIASKLIDYGCTLLLCEHSDRELPALNSIYTTTRTLSLGPQLICLKNGFMPMGLFPNAHKLENYETVTLMVKYRDGVLEKRQSLTRIPNQLLPILEAQDKVLARTNHYQTTELSLTGTPLHKDVKFEIIDAPNYVHQLFKQKEMDENSRFYPFHQPNILIVSASLEMEIFAYLSPKDRYLVIVSINQPIIKLRGALDKLLLQLEAIGVSYIELLVNLENTESIQVLLDANFQPSATYPAMKTNGEDCQDYIFFSRSMYPLDFRNIKLTAQFHPFLKQYMELWMNKNLESLEVFNDTH